MSNLPKQPPLVPSRTDPRTAAIDWPRFVEIVRRHRRFLLTTHIRPDGDAVGSVLAMAAMLEQLGKDVIIVTAFELPPNLRFLDPGGKIKRLGKDVSPGATRRGRGAHGPGHRGLGPIGRDGRSDPHHAGGQGGAGPSRQWRRPGGRGVQGRRARRPPGSLVFEAAERLGVPDHGADGRGRCSSPWRPTPAGSASPRRRPRPSAWPPAWPRRGPCPTASTRSSTRTTRFGRLQLIGRAMARTQTELDGRLDLHVAHASGFRRRAGPCPPTARTSST